MSNRRLIISFPMDDTRALSPFLINICLLTYIPFSQKDLNPAKAPASGNSAWKLFGLARRDKITLEVELLKITNI